MLIKPFHSMEAEATAPHRWRRRQVLRAGASTLFLGLLAPRLAYASSILGVRVWPAREYTRVTIESDQPLDYTSHILQGPDRVVVDLNGLDLDQTLKNLVAKITPNDPQIEQVRVGQFAPRVVRMVFDLKGAAKPQVFALQPAGAYRYRLVFDLYPAVAPDPLLELLAKTQRKEEALVQNAPSGSTLSGPQSPPAADTSDAFFERYAQEDPTESGPGATASGTTPPPGASTLAGPALTPRAPAVNAAPPAQLAQELHPPARGAEAHRTKPAKRAPAAAVPPQALAGDDTYGFTAARRPTTVRLLTVAIDPGHGGEDPGAIGSAGTYEKHIALDIGRKLRAKIDAQPNMRAMMTRDDDFFVPLNVRVQKARRVQADLFVSIHADAFITPSASGSSVFALSEHGASSTAARWMASKENSSDLIGGINIRSQDEAVSRALLDMSTTAQIHDSMRYGNFVLNEIGSINKLHKGSVEQAGFAVLKAPDIPSVLVETAFISNPEEEAKLNSEAYRNQMADAILRGIKHYFAANPPLAKSRTV